MTAADLGALTQQLVDEEGLRLRVYTDSRGIPTIGVGRNIRDKGLTLDEAMYLLENDIHECIGDLSAYGWFTALDGVRQRALVDLRFNLGHAKLFTFVKMLDALQRKDFSAAAKELVTSEWANQVQPSRRDRIATMLLTGAAA